MTGKRFGLWRVIKYHGKKHAHYWLCECQCDKKTIKPVRGSILNTGQSISCGCLKNPELVRKIKSQIKNKPYNEYDITNDYAIGYTRKNEEFYFDLDDYDIVKNYAWLIDARGYVKAHDSETQKEIKLHRLVMGANVGDNNIDHINRVKHDNRKSNLRWVNVQQNGMNQGLGQDNTSGVTGVSYMKNTERWVANLQYKGNRVRCDYRSKDHAIMQRLLWEMEYYKEYAPQKHLYGKYFKSKFDKGE